ncbi:MAG: RlmE family RNA methyltransferase [Myxococcota bacterium]|nr:RlmE family RNA methyltransferase [Myxococcota bacterium]
MVVTAPTMGKPYKPKDHFFKKAKAEGFRARSAFKIEEIAQRFSIFRKNDKVLDLGAAPGGFLQVIAKAVGAGGLVVGVDLAAIRPFPVPYVKTAVLDVLSEDFDAKLAAIYDGPFNAVVSDLAPKTSGIRSTDEARSLRLAGKALEVATARGLPGSHFIAKLFMGGDFEEFRNQLRSAYQEVKVVRPEATRGASMEVYLVGLRKKA